MARNRSVSNQLVCQPIAAGVRHVYGIEGDSLNPVAEAVRRMRVPTRASLDLVPPSPRRSSESWGRCSSITSSLPSTRVPIAVGRRATLSEFCLDDDASPTCLVATDTMHHWCIRHLDEACSREERDLRAPMATQYGGSAPLVRSCRASAAARRIPRRPLTGRLRSTRT
jgi:hypothetical protein